MEVKCKSGFSGGLDQRFIMDVFETVNNTQVLVATNWTEMQGDGKKKLKTRNDISECEKKNLTDLFQV